MTKKMKKKAARKLLALRDCVSKNIQIINAVSDHVPPGFDWVLQDCFLDLEKHLRRYEASIHK